MNTELISLKKAALLFTRKIESLGTWQKKRIPLWHQLTFEKLADYFYSYFPEDKEPIKNNVTKEQLTNFYKWIELSGYFDWDFILIQLNPENFTQERILQSMRENRLEGVSEEEFDNQIPHFIFKLLENRKKEENRHDWKLEKDEETFLLSDLFKFPPCPLCQKGENGSIFPFNIFSPDHLCKLHTVLEAMDEPSVSWKKRKREHIEKSYTIHKNICRQFLDACRNGEFALVELIHTKVKFDDYYNGIREAITEGRLRIVEFLVQGMKKGHWGERSIAHLMSTAILYHELDIAEYLLSKYSHFEEPLKDAYVHLKREIKTNKNCSDECWKEMQKLLEKISTLMTTFD